MPGASYDAIVARGPDRAANRIVCRLLHHLVAGNFHIRDAVELGRQELLSLYGKKCLDSRLAVQDGPENRTGLGLERRLLVAAQVGVQAFAKNLF